MRTTLTLDPDIAAKLKAEARRSGNPFKQVVNEALRRGLNTGARPKSLKPFRVKARDLGLRPGLSFDNVWELIEQIEGPFYK